MRRMDDTPLTLPAMLEATVRRKPDAPALGVIAGGELRWTTWREIHEAVSRQCGQLGSAEPNGGADARPTEHNSLQWIVHDLALLKRRDNGAPEKTVATVVPTSGTSGEPRSVVLSQRNLAWTTQAVSQVAGGSGDEIRLSFLPFNHLYARVCDLYVWVYRGSRLVLAEGRDTILRDCRIVRPTTINGVPYFFQKVLDRAQADGAPVGVLLGGAIKHCYSGGAALAAEVQYAFAAQGVPLMNGYGLSEASPVVTMSSIDDNRPGTVGRPLPGVEVRLADDGEVLVRGPNVMLGYWRDEAATSRAIQDGWLHTGDLGEWDEAGHMVIRGRKKEVLTLSTGKNVLPARIEALLCASPWIEQACVVGDARNCLGAIIVPNPQRVRAEVRARRLWVLSKRRALSHKAIRAIYAEEIERCLKGCAHEEHVRAFTLIGRAFSVERGEMTAKLSLRRAAIEAAFAPEIERMFAQRASVVSA